MTHPFKIRLVNLDTSIVKHHHHLPCHPSQQSLNSVTCGKLDLNGGQKLFMNDDYVVKLVSRLPMT